MKVTKVILLFFVMLLVSTEVFTMAIKSDVGNVPKWLGNVSTAQGGGGNKNNNQLAQRADNYKGSSVLANTNVKTPQPKKNNDQIKNADPQMPAWLEAAIGAATGGAMQNPVIASAAMGGYATQQSNVNPKDMNTLRDNPKPYDAAGIPLGSGEAPGNTMSDYLRSLYANNAAMGDPYSQPGYGNGNGLGSRYGGNWGRGGGGGWGGGGGYDSPAWLNHLLNLYSWNIR